MQAKFDCVIDKYTDEISSYTSMKVSAKASDVYTFTKLANVSTSCDDFESSDDICVLSYENEKEKHILAWSEIWDKS